MSVYQVEVEVEVEVEVVIKIKDLIYIEDKSGNKFGICEHDYRE